MSLTDRPRRRHRPWSRHRHGHAGATAPPPAPDRTPLPPAVPTAAGPDQRAVVEVRAGALDWFQVEGLAEELRLTHRVVESLGPADAHPEAVVVLVPLVAAADIRALRRARPRAALVLTSHGTVPGPLVAALLEAGADTCVASATTVVVAAYVRSFGRREPLVA